MAVTITVGADDLSNQANNATGVYVDRQWSITNSIDRPNSANFYIVDNSNQYTPPLKAVVSMRNDDGTLLFSGLIVKRTPNDYAIGRIWQVVCAGWMWELDGFISEAVTYIGKTDQYIIAAQVSDGGNPPGVLKIAEQEYGVRYDVSDVDESPLIHQALQWQGDTVRSIISELAEASGYAFWIDGNREIHYKLPQNIKSARVSYGNGGVPVEDVVPTEDLTNLATSVYVIGNFGFTENYQYTYPTNGGTLLLLGFRWSPNPQQEFIDIEVNIGTDAAPVWDKRTVGFAGYSYEVDPEVYWDSIGSNLTFDRDLPTLTKGVRVSGAQRYANTRLVQDDNAVARYGRRTVTVKDPSIITFERLYLRTQAVLNRHAQTTGGVTFSTRQYVAVGRLARFVSNKHQIDRTYVIESVAIRAVGNTEIYEVVLTPIASNVIL